MTAPSFTRIAFLSAALACAVLAVDEAKAQRDPPVLPADLATYCQAVACRQNSVVQVRLPDGRIQEERSTIYRPAIVRNSVSILLGEEVRAVPEFDDDQLQGWRAAERRESARTPVLTFKLAQETGGDLAVSLVISNSGREPVKLRLSIRTAGSASAEYTSSCPVLAGGTVYEYWTQPVVEVVVREATVPTDESALMCD